MYMSKEIEEVDSMAAKNFQKKAVNARQPMSKQIEGFVDKNPNIIAGFISTKIIEFQKRSINFEEPILGRIPDTIRAKHGNEYDPHIIAIGPYHRSNGSQGEEINPKLKPMETMKLKFIIDLCQRETKNKCITEEEVLKTLIVAIQKQQVNARKEYCRASFEMTVEDFVQMLVLDGCFIVELLLKLWEKKSLSEIMPMIFQGNKWMSLERDLLLYENQIPFFILEEIFRSCSSMLLLNASISKSILKLALFYLHFKDIREEMLPKEFLQESNPKKIHHLLHLSHICLVSKLNPIEASQHLCSENQQSPSSENQQKGWPLRSKQQIQTLLRIIQTVSSISLKLKYPKQVKQHLPPSPKLLEPSWKSLRNTQKNERPRKAHTIPTATCLKESGVQLRKKVISGNGNYLDISFKDGIMAIPSINIVDNTLSVYCNLVALEQSHKEYGNKFTAYVRFMDHLIDTTDDVYMLMKKKIIVNRIGSMTEVVKLFNEICIGLVFDPDNHYLIDIYKEINKYCVKTINVWQAKLRHDYFSNPWSIISVLTVFFLLIFAIVQTTCSLLEIKN